MNNLKFACIIILLILGKVSAQDLHFTNFTQSPITLNPSLTGEFLGTYRVTGIYRSQWGSVTNFGDGFSSYNLNVDGNIAFGLRERDWVSLGLGLTNDQAGSLNYRTSLTGLHAAYHAVLDNNYDRILSIGLSRLGAKTKVDPNIITLNSLSRDGYDANTLLQFDGLNAKVSYSDMIFGVSYKQRNGRDGDIYKAGISIAHITTPDNGFQRGRSERDTNSVIIGGQSFNPSQLDKKGSSVKSRITLFGQYSTMLNNKIRLNPAFMMQVSNGNTEVVVQAKADYLLNKKKQIVVSGGLGYRFGDALQILLGAEKRNLQFGISFDVTTSKFSKANGGFGGFELYAGYVGQIFKKPDIKPAIFCPRL